MNRKEEIRIGQVFGDWTIAGSVQISDRGEKVWPCRCVCGTERNVRERSLRAGTSGGCGCTRKEKIRKARAFSALEGKTYGELTVLYKAADQSRGGGVWWTCRCSCGAVCDVKASLLVTGRKTHCAGKIHTAPKAGVDIKGQWFGRLEALYPQDQRDRRNSVIWHCRCDCGKEIDISYNNLVYCGIKSCGCLKKEKNQTLKQHLTHFAGTSLDMVMSEKVPTNNTTGARGVYYIRGHWVAKIVIQKKAYYLGSYDVYEDAVRVRQETEKYVRESLASYYETWKRMADADPRWAEENPIQIQVTKKDENALSIECTPRVNV